MEGEFTNPTVSQSVVQDIGRTTAYKGKQGVIREQYQYLKEVIEALIWRSPYEQAPLSRFGILLATSWESMLDKHWGSTKWSSKNGGLEGSGGMLPFGDLLGTFREPSNLLGGRFSGLEATQPKS